MTAPKAQSRNTRSRLTFRMRKQETVRAAKNTGRAKAPSPNNLEIRKSAQTNPILPPAFSAVTPVVNIRGSNDRLWSEVQVNTYETRATSV